MTTNPTATEAPLSQEERWANLSSDELIATARKENKHFNLALRTVEVVTPSLMKIHEGYLSNTGEDIKQFLHILLDPDANQVVVSVVDNATFEPRFSLCDNNAKDLMAAFLCDFPDAIFSLDQGYMPLLFAEIPVGNTVPGYIPGELVKRHITLNTMLEIVQNKWHSKLSVRIALPREEKPQ